MLLLFICIIFLCPNSFHHGNLALVSLKYLVFVISNNSGIIQTRHTVCSVGDRQERGEHSWGVGTDSGQKDIVLVCTFGRLCTLSKVSVFLSKQLAACPICLRGGGGVNRLLCSNFINFRTSVIRRAEDVTSPLRARPFLSSDVQIR